jgi:hypothetical protein
MPLRDVFFNSISNITSFPICIPRIAALDDFENAQNITDVAILKSRVIQKV